MSRIGADMPGAIFQDHEDYRGFMDLLRVSQRGLSNDAGNLSIQFCRASAWTNFRDHR